LILNRIGATSGRQAPQGVIDILRSSKLNWETKMVLFVYVDNSNVWIEGRRASAVSRGMARSMYEAKERDIFDPGWTYDFGQLYELVCREGSRVGRSILFGSKPPPNDSLWELAHDKGFEDEVFDRSASGREKEVDTGIVTMMLDDSYRYMQAERGDKAVLLAGDRDYVPALKSLKERGIETCVVFWGHATARDLREEADEFISLDPHLERLAFQPTAAGV
jgi:hypothetical protein